MMENGYMIDRNAEGAWRISAEVRDSVTPFSWHETRCFYFYTKREALQAFREGLKRDGMRIVKG